MMKIAYCIFLLLIFSCQPYPKDTHNSYEEAKTSGLQVGVVVNPPFTVSNDDSLSGLEIEILRDFAEYKHLDINFEKGSESELIEKMEQNQLHIITGGFDKNTLWKEKTKPSATYDEEHVFLVPRGENRLLQELETFIFKKVRKQ